MKVWNAVKVGVEERVRVLDEESAVGADVCYPGVHFSEDIDGLHSESSVIILRL